MASASAAASAQHTNGYREDDLDGGSAEDHDVPASAWDPAERFRELVQYWRDSIVSTFHIPEDEFTVKRHQVDGGFALKIVYNVPNPDPRVLFPEHLGRIQFHGRWMHEDYVGLVKITHRQANLQPRHFEIGAAGVVQDSNKPGKLGVPVRFGQFREWCRIALFLQDLREGLDIVRTSYGHLLMKHDLCGALYFNGYLLRESTPEVPASASGKPLKFGYNFRPDSAPRKWGEPLLSPMKERYDMLHIWQEALDSRPQHVRHLHDMLTSVEVEYADVEAKYMINKATVERLRNHLVSHTTKWYYPAKAKAENKLFDEIVESLGREGVELPDHYWSMIENHRPLRTAEQEHEALFTRAERTSIPMTEFAKQMRHLTRACLRNSILTKDATVRFVKGGQLLPNVWYDTKKRRFSIHDKWLQRDECLRILELPAFLTVSATLFQAMNALFAEVLDKVPPELFRTDDGKTHEACKRRDVKFTQLRLLEYTQINRHFCLENFDEKPNSLVIKWIADTVWTDTQDVMVHLHREMTCLQMLRRHISDDFDGIDLPCITPNRVADGAARQWTETRTDIAPACRSVKVNIQRGMFVFERLKRDTSYFAIIFSPVDAGFITQFSNHCMLPETTRETWRLTLSPTAFDHDHAPPTHPAPGADQPLSVVAQPETALNFSAPVSEIDSAQSPVTQLQPPQLPRLTAMDAPLTHPQESAMSTQLNHHVSADTTSPYDSGDRLRHLPVMEPRNAYVRGTRAPVMILNDPSEEESPNKRRRVD